MTANRRVVKLEPITWAVVTWKGPLHYKSFSEARKWCRENVGVERADWEYQALHRRWRFRDPEMAFLFQMTWS